MVSPPSRCRRVVTTITKIIIILADVFLSCIVLKPTTTATACGGSVVVLRCAPFRPAAADSSSLFDPYLSLSFAAARQHPPLNRRCGGGPLRHCYTSAGGQGIRRGGGVFAEHSLHRRRSRRRVVIRCRQQSTRGGGELVDGRLCASV
ncbi:hypothetical protein Hanom_Chr15g01390971 [Helianthus anomalus]